MEYARLLLDVVNMRILVSIVKSACVVQSIWKPIHQSKVRFLPEETICLEKYHLFISHDNTPVCVKESSVEKLLELGFILGKSNNDSPYD